MTDLARRAEWKTAVITLIEDFLNPVTRHPIHKLRNFIKFLNMGDLMHLGPLGVLQWFLGSVLWELVYDGVWGDNPSECLARLWEEILEKYQEKGTSNRISSLKLSMFFHGADKFTCLSAKASDTVALLYVVHEICQEYSDGSRRDFHRLRCFERLCFIFNTVQANGHMIPRAEAEAMLASYDDFLVHYNWLANFSINLGRLNYNITIKFHILWHCMFFARFSNPKLHWCYEFYDFIGCMITCAKGCMAGSPLSIVGRKCFESFIIVLQLRIRQWPPL